MIRKTVKPFDRTAKSGSHFRHCEENIRKAREDFIRIVKEKFAELDAKLAAEKRERDLQLCKLTRQQWIELTKVAWYPSPYLEHSYDHFFQYAEMIGIDPETAEDLLDLAWRFKGRYLK